MTTMHPGRPRRAALLVGLLFAVTACGSSPTPTFPPLASARGSATPGTPSPTEAATEPGVPDPGDPGSRPDLAGLTLSLEPIVGGLAAPVFVTDAGDGSGRLFVAEQGGVIRIVRDGMLLPEPFADLSDRISAGGEQGLLGLAFPPGFGPERPVLFVHYSDRDGDTVIAELRVSADDPDRVDPSSERIVLQVDQPYPNHNGGWIGFDADGMLLVALGDGGSGGDPENRASNPDELLGKMLRIDVLAARGEGDAYSIPADNPFVGQAGARPEVLHYGLRNPFRASVDRETGDLWIGDVGQNAWEEVDVARAGARGLDFGWRRWEASECFDEAAGCDEAGVTMPIATYPTGNGCAVIGGVVYRGDVLVALRGAYVFSDYCSGTLWGIDAGVDATQAPIVLAETGRSVSSIAMDEDGELLVTDLGGELLRVVAGS